MWTVDGAVNASWRVGRPRDPAVRLLQALRAAGCDVFIDREDGVLYCSPPLRHIEWDDDPEAAIEAYYQELKALMCSERLTVH